MISSRNTVIITLLVIILLLSGCVTKQQDTSIDNKTNVVIQKGPINITVQPTNDLGDNLNFDNQSDNEEDIPNISNQGLDEYGEDTENVNNIDYGSTFAEDNGDVDG